jgi:hypothetical protein
MLPGALTPAEPVLASTPRGADNITSVIKVNATINFFKIPIIFP